MLKKLRLFLLLTLTILVNVIQIACQAQSIKCDSSISVCPKVFDRLIKNDILADKYRTDYLYQLSISNQLSYVIIQKDISLVAKDSVIKISEQETLLTNSLLKDSKKILSKANRKIKLQQVALWVSGALIIAETGYIGIKSFFN